MNENQVQFTVKDVGERLDKLIVAQLNDVSRVQAQALIKDGHVTVDGAAVKAGIKLRGGETVLITLPQAEATAVTPEAIALSVIYEDDDLAVIDKPAGLVVHPGVGNESGTLVNAILSRWPEIATMNDPDERHGIAHRLDKDTSGLMVIAKNDTALAHLMQQFQARSVDKFYLALLERTPKTLNGRIEAPIGRDPKQRKRMTVTREGKTAVTEFIVLDDNFREGQALVEFKLLTGRTHQIRVHAAFIGSPVVGDSIYGFRKQRIKLKRNFLHAARLAFDHPRTSERLTFESPLPAALSHIMEKMKS